MKAIENKVLVQVQKSGPTEKIGSFVLPDDPNGLETATVLSVGEKVEVFNDIQTKNAISLTSYLIGEKQ